MEDKVLQTKERKGLGDKQSAWYWSIAAALLEIIFALLLLASFQVVTAVLASLHGGGWAVVCSKGG